MLWCRPYLCDDRIGIAGPPNSRLHLFNDFTKANKLDSTLNILIFSEYNKAFDRIFYLFFYKKNSSSGANFLPLFFLATFSKIILLYSHCHVIHVTMPGGQISHEKDSIKGSLHLQLLIQPCFFPPLLAPQFSLGQTLHQGQPAFRLLV